jgi:prolyl 4-hydroxylase
MLQPVPRTAPGGSGYSEFVAQPFQMLSWYPRMYLFPRFLSPEQAQHVVELAKARLAPSVLAFKKGDTQDNTKDVRTSSGTFISRFEDKAGVLAHVEDKIAKLTGLPVSHGEPFNVLRYDHGQHYDSHYDVFSPEEYGPQSSQRLATVLFYLTDVEEGGETVFPLEGKDGLSRLATINYKSCDMGLKYKPKAGDALLFWSIHPNGTFDKHALHGGCAVVKGQKWVATKWIRDKCFSSC